MMRQAFSDDHQPDGDWLSPENLLGKTFRVEVATVNKNHAREALGSRGAFIQADEFCTAPRGIYELADFCPCTPLLKHSLISPKYGFGPNTFFLELT